MCVFVYIYGPEYIQKALTVLSLHTSLIITLQLLMLRHLTCHSNKLQPQPFTKRLLQIKPEYTNYTITPITKSLHRDWPK